MATTKITSPDLFNLESLNTALKLPSGTTAQRPTSPSTGEWRYNTTTNYVEFWDGGAWRDLQSEDIPPTPSENFNTVTWTGDDSDGRAITVGFKPDFVWIKPRNLASSNRLFDSTRGATKFVISDSTGTEQTASNTLQSFSNTGFTLGISSAVNESPYTYVAWCWKANGGTTSSNTDGTITSTVQVNTKAGFSIMRYTGNGTSGATIGHGLGAAPDLIISRNLVSVTAWGVYHKYNTASPAGQRLKLNLPDSTLTTNDYWAGVEPTSTVLSVGTEAAVNDNTKDYIMYAFKAVAGYSSFGSYTGNGANKVISTGLEPAWLMIKRTNGTGTWLIYDNKRNTSNPRNTILQPNESAAEVTSSSLIVNFLTNGFEVTGNNGDFNGNGDTYVYIAFAADASAAPTLGDSFDNLLYTGTGSDQTISGYSFNLSKGSLLWVKSRNASNNWNQYDTIRGPKNRLVSNLTAAQDNLGGLDGFTSDGFTLRGGYDISQAFDYVTYAWKTNIPAINTDGTIQSVVSANQAAGCSVIGWTGDGSASATVGHGLSGTPDFIMLKDLTDVGGWNGAQVGLASNEGIGLQSNAPAFTGMGGNGGITYANLSATNFGFATGSSGVDSVNKNGNQYIAYCWKSVAGFSSIASYSGNGGSKAITGLGFQPSWVMIKSTGSGNWMVYDNLRTVSVGDNPGTANARPYLIANSVGKENGVTSYNVNLDSDGFSMDTSAGDLNTNGQTYIYMAYKENPAQYAIPSGQMGYLLAAGGGGSGADSGGGAGAGGGGLRTTYGLTSGGGASAETNLTLATGTYTITVGAGGAAYDGSTTAQNGVATTITGVASVSTVGGGAGGDFLKSGTAYKGNAGGSGGGSANSNGALTLAGGAGTANEGFAGGGGFPAGSGNDNNAAGGGGGSAQVGVTATSGVGGNGGNGLIVAITGSNAGYAGGGGGGCRGTGGTTAGQGGNGGGGNAVSTGNGNPGTANTGGGAGGGRANGANGGSGVVVLRLNTSDYSGTTTGSPTVTTNGSETILTYTGSGTYVHS